MGKATREAFGEAILELGEKLTGQPPAHRTDDQERRGVEVLAPWKADRRRSRALAANRAAEAEPDVIDDDVELGTAVLVDHHVTHAARIIGDVQPGSARNAAPGAAQLRQIDVDPFEQRTNLAVGGKEIEGMPH